MSRGIRCPQCGASTPLPDDLRVPTFACAFCQKALVTADFAGVSAVSADALLGHMESAFADPATAMDRIHEAPRFVGGSTQSRAMACLRCSAPVEVPLDLEVRELRCAGCGQTQAIHAYIPDDERFRLDMERQVAGNDALKRIQAEGVPCGRCGGQNRVPDDGSVQFVCAFCGAAILLSDHVDATAVARQRMKHGVYGMRDELRRQQAERDAKVKWIVAAVVVAVTVAVAAINLLAG